MPGLRGGDAGRAAIRGGLLAGGAGRAGPGRAVTAGWRLRGSGVLRREGPVQAAPGPAAGPPGLELRRNGPRVQWN